MPHKQTEQWIRKIRRTPGFHVRRTGGGHLMVRNDNGLSTVIPSTPSDGRSWLNSRAALRRIGLDI
jgi:predicted RNA binding protein YcfA (HicA-like mRNA interferase family)